MAKIKKIINLFMIFMLINLNNVPLCFMLKVQVYLNFYLKVPNESFIFVFLLFYGKIFVFLLKMISFAHI